MLRLKSLRDLQKDQAIADDQRDLTSLQTNLDSLRTSQQTVEEAAEKDKTHVNQLMEAESAPRAKAVSSDLGKLQGSQRFVA